MPKDNGEGDQEEFENEEAEITMDKTQDVTSPLRTPEGKKEKDDDELTEDDDITLESS